MLRYQVVSRYDKKGVLKVKEKGLLRFLLPLDLREILFYKAIREAVKYPGLIIEVKYSRLRKVITSYFR